MIITSLLFLLLLVSYFGYWRGRGMDGFYTSKPMMISHRGVTKKFPENTVEAFVDAEKLGFEGIELDVIASKDGVLYCSHNYQLDQETNSSGYIHVKTSNELDNIKTGFYSHPESQKNIPRLSDVFDKVSKNIRLNIEIKFSGLFDLSTISSLRKFLKQNAVNHNILISSFNPLIVFYARWLIPSVKTGYLVEGYNMIKWINFCHPDSLHLRADFLDKEIISVCKQKELTINTWTVNSISGIGYCKNLKVDGIITDLEVTHN